jgi:hypothetical protein
MPEYMMAEIMQGLDQIGALESLESKIGYWQQYRERAKNRIIREYLADSSLVGRQDSIVALYQDESSLQSKYRLAFTQWESNQTEEAHNTLSGIPLEFELSSREQDIHQLYLDYFDILQMLGDSNLNIRQLDSLHIQNLTTIMDSDAPLISNHARGLLIKGWHIDFTEVVSFPSQIKSFPAYYFLDPAKSNFPEEDHLILFPNPCGDYVICYFNTFKNDQKGSLEIYDLNGRLLNRIRLNSLKNQRVINLYYYADGIYIVQLIVDYQFLSTKLLIKGRK